MRSLPPLITPCSRVIRRRGIPLLEDTPRSRTDTIAHCLTLALCWHMRCRRALPVTCALLVMLTWPQHVCI